MCSPSGIWNCLNCGHRCIISVNTFTADILINYRSNLYPFYTGKLCNVKIISVLFCMQLHCEFAFYTEKMCFSQNCVSAE